MNDQLFIRGKTPMTKSEVRAVVLSKLSLREGSVLADIGAGTGSVSVEAALYMSGGMVAAIEREPEACALIEKNRDRFGINNIRILCESGAKAVRETDLTFTHAFIGGAGEELEEILDLLLCKNPQVRIALTAISLETLARIVCWLDSRKREAEIVQVQISRAKRAGSHRLMLAQNPVYVITFGGESNYLPEEPDLEESDSGEGA